MSSGSRKHQVLELILTHSQNSAPDSPYIEQMMRQWGLDDVWKHQFVSWDHLRTLLKDAVFKKSGAEIAQVGSTWVSGLMGMNALRPFTEAEVTRIQREGNFLPVAWNTQTIGVESNKQVWSIPWSTDARVIYYWADMFEDAGVDPRTAFTGPASFEAALEKLQAAGFETPWIACTGKEVNTVHHVCMWIWQYGGELLSESGREVLFAEEPALKGMEAYFRLHRFMPQTPDPLGEADILSLFHQRKVACIITGTWVVNPALRANTDLITRLSAALPPAPPYIGGTNLVVMQHLSAHQEQSAIDLIVHLTSEEFITHFAPMAGYDLPARSDVLEKSPFVEHPFMPVLTQALQVGRTIPNMVRWGIVEDELVKSFHKIWMEIKAHPDQPLLDIIVYHLKPLANRLNRTLAV